MNDPARIDVSPGRRDPLPIPAYLPTSPTPFWDIHDRAGSWCLPDGQVIWGAQTLLEAVDLKNGDVFVVVRGFGSLMLVWRGGEFVGWCSVAAIPPDDPKHTSNAERGIRLPGYYTSAKDYMTRTGKGTVWK